MSAKFKRLSANPVAVSILVSCVEKKFSDKQIQEVLLKECKYEWTLDTIKRHRLKLKACTKDQKAQQTEIEQQLSEAPLLSSPPYGLEEYQKAQWFRSQFMKTNMFKTICQQFEAEEVAIYLDDYGNLCCQFEDIVLSEFFQIDDFLKHQILVNRQLILARKLQQEITGLQDWFLKHPRQDEEDKDTVRNRVVQQRGLEGKYKHLKVVNDRYDALMKEKQRMQQNLAATRKDRLEELRGGKETFFALITELQHSGEARDRHGRLAELTRLSAKDIAKEFRKPIKFQDGEELPMIMDSETYECETSDE